MIASLIFALIFSGVALADANSFDQAVEGSDGSELCCKASYFPCYKSCPRPERCPECAPWDQCARDCEKKHCQTKKDSCQPAKETPPLQNTFSEVHLPTPLSPEEGNGRIQHDGRLPGPGTVRYEIFNRHFGEPPLKVNGIIYGKDTKNQVIILKKSLLIDVAPSDSQRFELEVSPSEYESWNKKYNNLTIAITIPPEFNAKLWRYENLLKEEDATQTRPGEFQVKGAFHYRK